MRTVEAFLDETPGETRGVVVRNGRFEYLLIHRDDDPPQHRLGARSVGRVARIEPALNGVFVDLGVGAPFGFLPTKGQRLVQGGSLEVEVTAEPRDGKGPVLKILGAAQGEPRLVAPGPDIPALLAELAPGVVPVGGVAAIQAGWAAEEEALASGSVLEDLGLDIGIERTRALVAVDFDWSATTHLHGNQARARANAAGLAEAARLTSLKGWGGLVAIDLIGTALDGEAVAMAARQAFGGHGGVVIGPVNRFGVLMLSQPWRWRPIETILLAGGGGLSLRTQAQAMVRQLNHDLQSNRAVATITLRCSAPLAEIVKGWVGDLGPRAHLITDPTLAQGQYVLEEG